MTYQRNGALLGRKFTEYLFPTIISNMSILLASFVDGIIVSKLINDDAFSAVNLAEPVILFMQALFFLFGIGGAICISIAKGQRDEHKANAVFTLSFLSAVLVSVIVTVPGIVLIDPITRVLCSDSTLYDYVQHYALFNIYGSLFMIVVPYLVFIIRPDGEFEFITDSPDFVVAIEEDVSYHCRKLTLKNGDMLFLYTDGVTEAVDSGEEMFGEDRLKETLNKAHFESAGEICVRVSEDISAYTRNAPQSDDITMLAVVYNGSRIFEEMTVDAELMQLEGVYSFIKQQLRSCGFDSDSIAQFSIIADEICANIVRYAYPDGGGKLTAGYSFDPASNEAALTFTDEGIPFNPLKAPNPDLENPEDREEGGLGLFLVRKFSDRLQYEYSNGKNILTIIKKRN